jgi:arylsulfatase
MTNIVLLTVDSLRADHCSSYGYERETTPRLDAFATDGVRFANAYSPSSHTRESVPAILTGQYPHAAVDDAYHCVAPTLAALLGDHRSGAFHSNPFVSRAYGFDRDFDVFGDDLYLGQHKLLALAQRLWDKIRGHHYARAETINERTLQWLDSLDGGPFFLWNHYMDVHGPYEPPEPYRGEFTDEDLSAADARDLYDRALDDPESITESELQLLTDLYDGEVRYTDAQIGRFLDALDERGMLADTVVVVTSDHGDELGDNGQYGHPRHLHDELVRVPVLADGLGTDGHVSEVPVIGLDVVPTLLTAAGEGSNGFAGRPFQDLLADGSAENRCVVLEARGEDEHSDLRRYRALDSEETLSFERELTGTAVPEGEDSVSECLRAHLTSEKQVTGTDSDGDEAVVSDRLETLGYK